MKGQGMKVQEIKGQGNKAMMEQLMAMDFEILGQAEPAHLPTGRFGLLAFATEQGANVIARQCDISQVVQNITPDTLVVLHNALYDLRYFLKFGVDVRDWQVWDTLLAERVMYGGYYSSFGLDDLVRRYFGEYRDKSIRNDFEDGVELSDEHLRYARQDALDTFRVAQVQMSKMSDRERQAYLDIERPAMMAVLCLVPPKIDVDRWLQVAEQRQREYDEIVKRLGFNPNSVPEVKRAIKWRLGVVVENTERETLIKFGHDEMVQDIIRAREIWVLMSTFGRSWVDKFVGEDGVLYTPDWQVIKAETGRMACSAPNLQNIPIREHPEYRTCFVARPDHKIVAMDAKAQEARVIAHLADDETLRRAFEVGEDPYIGVAVNVFGDAGQRKRAKAIFLGLNYGMSPKGLAKRLECDEETAERYIRKFFGMYRGVHRYMEHQRYLAVTRGYVESASGIKTWLNPYSGQRERNAINAPVQRTAAEITKLALALQQQYAKQVGIPFCTTMIIHDELVADVPEEYVDRYVEITRAAWLDAARKIITSVPFETDVAIGDNWGVKG